MMGIKRVLGDTVRLRSGGHGVGWGQSLYMLVVLFNGAQVLGRAHACIQAEGYARITK